MWRSSSAKADFTKAEAEGRQSRASPRGTTRDLGSDLACPQGGDREARRHRPVHKRRGTDRVGQRESWSGNRLPRGRHPRPPNRPDKPGAIEGKVTENDVAQPGLVVYLIDPKAKDKENPVKDQKKTDPDGTYSFLDLKPGLYRVFCVKEATNRRATKDVTVESGKTVRQDLDLLLP